jgi:hypothetical protein
VVARGPFGATMLKGFISYAHDDHAAFEEMRTHLRAIERAFGIELWADKRIAPGNYWSAKIADAIEAAEVHVLMFSPAFIGSNYIFDHELPAIDAKCARGDMVLPVVIHRCTWSWLIGVLQAAPVDRAGRLLPVFDWRPRANGFDAARDQIWSAMAARFGIPKAPFPWGRP